MNKFVIEHVLPPSGVERLWNNLLLLDNTIIPRLSNRVVIENYANKLAHLADIFYVKYKNKDIGNCAVYLNHKSYAFISSIALQKEYQGLGIGKYVYKRVKEETQRKGISKIRLDVWKNNTNAIKFYKKVGFIIIGAN